MNEVQRKIQMLKESGAEIDSRKNLNIPPNRGNYVTTLTFGGGASSGSASPTPSQPGSTLVNVNADGVAAGAHDVSLWSDLPATPPTLAGESRFPRTAGNLFPSQSRVKWTPLTSPPDPREANAKNRSFSVGQTSLLNYSTQSSAEGPPGTNGNLTGSSGRGTLPTTPSSDIGERRRANSAFLTSQTNGAHDPAHTENDHEPRSEERRDSLSSSASGRWKATPPAPPPLHNTTQTEILPTPNGSTTLVESGNYRANVQLLIAELDAAKDLNKKLSLNLVKAERDLASLRIQSDVQSDRSEADIASKVAAAVRSLRAEGGGSAYSRSRSDFSAATLAARRPPLADKLSQTDQGDSAQAAHGLWREALEEQPRVPRNHEELGSLLTQLEGASLSPAEMAANCEAMLGFVSAHGCAAPPRIQPSDGSAAELRLELAAAKEKAESLRNEKEELAHDVARKNGLVTGIREELEKLKQEKYGLEDRLRDAAADKKRILGEADALRAKAEKGSADHAVEVDKLHQELAATSDSLQRALATENRPRSADSGRLSEAEAEKRELNQQLERELGEKQELFLQINTLLGRLAEAEAAAASDVELAALGREKEKLATELGTLRASVEQIQASSEAEAGRLRTSLQATEKEGGELKGRLADLFDELEKEKEARAKEETRLKALIEESKAAGQGDDERLQAELRQLRESASAARADAEKAAGRAEQAEAKWEQQLYALRSQFSEADEERFRLREQLAKAEKDAADAAKDQGYGDASERVQGLTDANAKLKADLDKQQRLVAVLRRKINTQK